MPLSDDQKAMLRLLAQREQGYDDLAALMGLSVDEVRVKVKDALAQLEERGETQPPPAEPEPPAPERVSPPPEPEPRKPASASEVAAEPVAAEPAAAPQKASQAKAVAPPRRSVSIPSSGRARAGIAAGALALLALVLVLIIGGGDGDSGDTTTASGDTTGAAENAADTGSSKLTQAILSPVGDSDGSGVATFGRVKNRVVLQLEAQGLEPSPAGSSYTVWLYKSPQLALRIGAVEVTKSGGIAAQFPVPTELLAYVASGAFDQIDLSLTSTAAYNAEIARAKKEKRLPLYTGEDVLRGEITGPAIEAAAAKNGK
jgi:hypothetical protein